MSLAVYIPQTCTHIQNPHFEYNHRGGGVETLKHTETRQISVGFPYRKLCNFIYILYLPFVFLRTFPLFSRFYAFLVFFFFVNNSLNICSDLANGFICFFRNNYSLIRLSTFATANCIFANGKRKTKTTIFKANMNSPNWASTHTHTHLRK